jgi:hypothetical protein
MYFFTVW